MMEKISTGKIGFFGMSGVSGGVINNGGDVMWKPMLLGLAILLLPAFSPARTTWVDKEVDCPVCETKNTFQTPASWGSYIYRWASKYQYIFWPTTHRNFIYTCSSCS